jgi:heavy metal efflux system protein
MNRLIQLALKSRLLVVVLGVLTLGAGYFAYKSLPVDAFPDLTPSLVQIWAETEGLAPQEVEKYVTYPIEVAMNGLPGIKEIRSVSNFGLSVVNIYFDDGMDVYFARQLVSERLTLAREGIPEGFAEPELGPITSGLGQILFFFVKDETGERSLEEVRDIQDWLVQFNLQTVPGVTEVLSLGGQVKQFQVQVRPLDLLRYDLTLAEVVEAVESNNSNVGAQFIVKNSEEYLVRSVGLAENVDDLERIVLKTTAGTPVYLSHIADVITGGEIRRGLATMNGQGEVVAGMVLKLLGANTSEVIGLAKQRMAEISKVLPPGIRLVPYYDQATLVKKCVRTVTSALLQAVVLIIIIQLVLMGSFRPSVVVFFSIPFSLAFSFLLMKYLGISANLMSLGGLAIALGILVDGSVVMVENADRHISEGDGSESITKTVARAASEVVRPITFSLMIIVIVFVPLFTLQGVEGKTFRPLAATMALALFGSLIFAVLFAPVLSSLLMRRPKTKGAKQQVRTVRWLIKFYRPAVSFFVRKPSVAVALSIVLVLIGAILFTQLGSEFVPRLIEGDLLILGSLAPSISLDDARDTITIFERRLMEKFPEVSFAVTRVGRGEAGAHAHSVNTTETFVGLKPQDEWTSADSLDELYKKMSEEFADFPGVQFNYSQPIATAVDELLTGVKAELAIKIFGADLDVLKTKAEQVEKVVRGVRGATDVQKDQISGTPQLRITIDREAVARYGINVADVQSTIQAAVGGQEAGQIFEGIRRYHILVRYVAEARSDMAAISEILVPGPDGLRVPLAQLAAIEEIVGPRQITRENNQRFITVQCNVRGRDIGSFVEDAQKAIDDNVVFPPGYLVTWGGQFELQQQANKRMAFVIPVTLLMVFLLLFSAFNSLKSSLLILLNIPLALVGGVIALFITGQNLSVPASVGFIALFGIALSNGMVMVTYMNQLCASCSTMFDVCVEGACLRLRPVLMTASTTGFGLIPLILSSGTGSEVQRPLATVVIGGLVTSTALTLLVLPALYKWFAPKNELKGA